MDPCSAVESELKIPKKCCRVVSGGRVICLATEGWLKSLCQQKSLVSESVQWHGLSECEYNLLLAPSNDRIPKPWLRLSIKVITKSDELVRSLVEVPLEEGSSVMGHAELMAAISHENFRHMWENVSKKYRSASVHAGHATTNVYQKDFNVLMRETLSRLFRCNVITVTGQSMSSQSELGERNGSSYTSPSHPNVTKAHTIVECTKAFYVIQPYWQYSVHDLVTFSPAALSNSFAKPLFILYQVLQAIRFCHALGIPVGDLKLKDLLVDQKLWIHISLPQICRLYQWVLDSDESVITEQGSPSRRSRSVVGLSSLHGGVESLQGAMSSVHGGVGSAHGAVASLQGGINSRAMSIQMDLNRKAYTDYYLDDLPIVTRRWVQGDLGNFDYLMVLNHLAGRRMGDPNHHPVVPWVMDFTAPDCGFRDLTKSKFRLNKGDAQLDLTYDTSSAFLTNGAPTCDPLQIPHHISDVLSDITYFMYKARRTPKSILCAKVRPKWVPHEYPSSMERMQAWTPDECIPEFFTDPTIFASIHEDLPDLEVPSWAESPEDFVEKHLSILEGEYVSRKLHHWVDLTFGYKLSGSASVKAKNVCLQLVDQHSELTNHGVVQLFNEPHPQRLIRTSYASSSAPEIIRPNFEKQPVVDYREESFKKDSSLERKHAKTDSSLSEKKDPSRVENYGVVLPLGYEPASLLLQLEGLNNFSTRTAKHVPDGRLARGNVSDDVLGSLVAVDMQAFGCLMVELFLAARVRILSPEATLNQRYKFIRKLVSNSEDLPRPIRKAAEVLLHLQQPWTPDNRDPFGMLFKYDLISAEGLPPPSATLLLHPHISTLPFPRYFPSLYALLCHTSLIDHKMAHLLSSEQTHTEKLVQMKSLGREKVRLITRYISKNATQLSQEELDILIPYIGELLDDSRTSVEAAWSLFNPVSQALGPDETAKKFLPHLVKLFDGENTTPKHIKLYHRSFILQLFVRLGTDTFLRTFATLLVEAAAGYKNFFGEDAMDRQISNDVDLLAEDMDFPSVFVEDADVQKNDPSERDLRISSAEEVKPNSSSSFRPVQASVGDEVFPDDMSLDGNDDLKLPVEQDKGSSDSGSAEVLYDQADTQSITSTEIGGSADLTDRTSVSSMDVSEDMLSRSVGRVSVHSLSRFMQEDQDRGEHDSDASEDGPSRERSASTSSAVDMDNTDDSEKNHSTETVPMTAMVRSETEEFTSSIMDGSGNIEYNISDVAAETINWLAHRLGAVLTAKYLSRNLLRMLALCYLGEEQLEPIMREESIPSATGKYVAGDLNSFQLLECLRCIAVLYGEHVILLQYFPHIKELISVAQKRLTNRAEAGLIGCVVLVIHIIPYLSDATLMDILQETIFQDILLPLLKVVSAHVSFPGGKRVRSVICHKIIDVLYIISLRIGFEMTREHMTFVLQKFFATFNKVYDEKFFAKKEKLASPVLSSPPIPEEKESTSSEGQLFEIKMDSETNEFNVGASMISNMPNPGHQRQGSGSFRYSLSPAVQDEKEEADGSSPDDQDKISQELRDTFTPELAHLAYIPFCKLAGGIHMEQNLINDDLIRQLCALHDEVILQHGRQQGVGAEAANGTLDSNGTKAGPQTTWFTSLEGFQRSLSSEDCDVAGTFGATVEGNKITIQPDNNLSTEAGSLKARRKSGETQIDYTKLKSPEMEMNKQRHLKGNWLAYWEHEIGLSDRENSFNFKQIKLQTFSGHTNSVRSLYVVDNENSFLSASKDKTVKLWSLRSFSDGNGRVGCQWTYSQHRKSVFAVSFMESLRLAASCDSNIHIWDPFVGMCVHQFESAKNTPVTVLAPMPAPHSSLITASTDATVRFLDVRTMSFTHEFKCSTGPAGLIRCAAVSPDGHWVAVGYSSGVISILDARTGLLLASWKGHEGEILQIKAFSSKNLVTSSFDQSMSLWTVDDAKLVCHFKGLTEPAHCLCFYNQEVISATTANRVGVHTSLDRQASFSSTKLRSDVFKGVLTTMSILPLNRLLLLGADNGTVRLLA